MAEGVLASYPAEMKQIVKDHKILHRIFFITMPGETYTTDKWITVFTGKDVVNPREEALHLLQQSRTEGYDTLLERHNRRWEELWKHAEVKIRGDVKAMEAVNYSIYIYSPLLPDIRTVFRFLPEDCPDRHTKVRYSGIRKCLCWTSSL